MKKWMLVVGLVCSLGFSSYHKDDLKQTETIVFMRHAEKPSLDFGQLNCKGLNRSLALTKVLDAKFGKPDYIFAPHPYWKGFYYYVRALVTIEPTAIQLKMPVNAKYQFFYDDKVAKLLISPQYHNSLIFVAWEHIHIVFIAKKLMLLLGKEQDIIPSWPSDDFDSLYVIKIDWRSKKPKVNFIHDQQNLDNQSKSCPLPDSIKSNYLTGGQTILFIPEIEAAMNISDQLSCRGLNRALALPKVLSLLYPTINLFILPSPNPNLGAKSSNNFLLSLMTVEPTIINRGALYIPVGYNAIDDIVDYLRDPAFFSQTIAIAWPAKDIANLAQAIYKDCGGNPKDIPNPIPNIDTIYQITTNRGHNSGPMFKQIKEQLNNQPQNCP